MRYAATAAAWTGTAAASLILTEVLRRYSLAHGVLDVPNHRSAHTVPTPRGGGVAITLAFLAAVAAAAAFGEVSAPLAIVLCAGGLLVSTIGAIDDHRPLPPIVRLAAHVAAAIVAVVWLGGMSALSLGGITIGAQWAVRLAEVLFLTWAINLYNFMDGIDGIAGVEGLSVTLGAIAIAAASHAGGLLVPGLLAAATLGFLVRNWPPAAIFMGDAGSGFLGFTIGVLMIDAAARSAALFWVWMILLGVFFVDATLTLLVRLARGQRVYEPHRSHAYQHAARRFGAHLPVTLGVAAINVLWLLPLAALVATGRMRPGMGLAAAYAPLAILCIFYGAGRARSTP